jgi:hypothetical protein
MESFGLRLRTAHERDLRVFDFYGSPSVYVPRPMADGVTPLALERKSSAQAATEGQPLHRQSRGASFFPAFCQRCVTRRLKGPRSTRVIARWCSALSPTPLPSLLCVLGLTRHDYLTTRRVCEL